jgi:hypothetical protein
MTEESPTHNELLSMLSVDPQNRAHWTEFMRRFHGHICSVVARELKRQLGAAKMEAVEELVQLVYAKLMANSARALCEFRGCTESSAFRYLEIVAIRAVIKRTGIRP